MHQHRRAGCPLQLLDASHMVNVRVRRHDQHGLQPVPVENFLDALDVVARINHHRFARLLVAEDRAVAGEHADGNDFVNHTDQSATRLT